MVLIEIQDLIRENEDRILKRWMKNLVTDLKRHKELISEDELEEQSRIFLHLFVQSISKGELKEISSSDYKKIVQFLKNLSKTRVEMGFSASETALFIFCLKDALLPYIQKEYESDTKRMAGELTRINLLIDRLGLITFNEYILSKEQIIREQAEGLLELSSPIITLWDKVLAIPIIGTLDSNRTQTIMENLLNQIVVSGSKIAIIDITGVSVVDTQVANHLIKTVSAVRLLGAESIITGIRPEIAQTIVNLGLDLQEIITRANLSDGIKLAFEKLNIKVS